MAEDITDLTEDEKTGSKAKPEAKKKKQKEPKPKSPPKAKKEKQDKVNKGDKGNKGEKGDKKPVKWKVILIILLVLILLAAAFIFSLITNLFGVRAAIGEVLYNPIVALAVWFNPELTTLEEQLLADSDRRQQQLDNRESGQDRREEELAVREEDAAAKELALDRRELALDRREEQLNVLIDSTIPVFRRQMTEQERSERESLSRSIGSMAPADAARILAELPETIDAANVLFFMSERDTGAILAAMDPEFAAEITQILIGG